MTRQSAHRRIRFGPLRNQETTQIFRNNTDTVQGPGEWFTGAAFIDPLASPNADQHVNASNVHFTPGARTAWHAHPHGQTVWIT